MTRPPQDMIDEVDDLVVRITAFQEDRDRRIARHIRRARKGRTGLDDLRALGLDPTPELAALYWNWNGTDPGDRLNMWESNLWFDFDWMPMAAITRIAALNRRLTYRPDRRTVWLTNGTLPSSAFSLGIGLTLDDPLYGRIRLERGLCRRAFTAFDSPIHLLRTVVAAQENGVMHYDGDGRIGWWHEKICPLAAELNPQSEYWLLLEAGGVDWDPLSDEEIQEAIRLEKLWMDGDHDIRLPPALTGAAYRGAEAV